MKLRLPRLRRAAGGTVPEYRPDSDSTFAQLSPGRAMCTECNACHQCGAVAPGQAGASNTMAWLASHDCIEETT